SASGSPPRIAAMISGRVLPSTDRRTPLWRSRNLSIVCNSKDGCAAPRIGEACFCGQNCERWNIAVPLNQRRRLGKQPRGVRKQVPYRFGDVGAVIVDEHLAAVDCIAGMPRKVNLTDGSGRHAGQPLGGRGAAIVL